MEKSRIKPATAGDPSTLVLSLDGDEALEDRQFFAVPIAVRQGGILLALQRQLLWMMSWRLANLQMMRP